MSRSNNTTSSGPATDVAVGMMDTAYFVGKNTLLQFFNDLLDLQLTKIEQTASGAIACQLTEYIFPNSIPMTRVNWEAKSDYEYINNYKLLQAAFTKYCIQRHVDVDKLIRGKYQDNLEFCQWLKAFYDQSGCLIRDNYDAKAIRAKGKGGKKYNDSMMASGNNKGKPQGTSMSTSRRKIGVSPQNASMKPKVPIRPSTQPRSGATTISPTKTKAPLKTSSENTNQSRPQKASTTSTSKTNEYPNNVQEIQNLQTKNATLEKQLSELKSTLGDMEKERDFYFAKLRNVELMLQVKQDQSYDGCELEQVVDNIFKVLYATADEDVVVNEDGEIIPAGATVDVDTSALSAELSDALASELMVTEVEEVVADDVEDALLAIGQ